MLQRVSAPVSAPSIAPNAGTCTSSPVDLHQIIGIVRTVHHRGAAKWLQRVTGRSTRTVKYWLSGDYQPRGDEALKIAAALRIELEANHAKVQQFELAFQ